VIWGDHRIELTRHRSHENGVGRERSGDSTCPRRRRQKKIVFVPESPAVAGVRIQRAQRDARRSYSEPESEIVPGDCCRTCNRLGGQRAGDLSQGQVSRRQYHP